MQQKEDDPIPGLKYVIYKIVGVAQITKDDVICSELQ
jgi:hypothetical protein